MTTGVSEISRILKPGGMLILTVPGKDVPKHEKLPRQYDYRRFNFSDLRLLLEGQQFEEIEIQERYEQGKQINIFATAKKQ